MANVRPNYEGPPWDGPERFLDRHRVLNGILATLLVVGIIILANVWLALMVLVFDWVSKRA